jgi:hypothetical protein
MPTIELGCRCNNEPLSSCSGGCFAVLTLATFQLSDLSSADKKSASMAQNDLIAWIIRVVKVKIAKNKGKNKSNSKNKNNSKNKA